MSMRAGFIGQIVTPAAGNAVVDQAEYIIDNSAFAGKYPGNAAFLAYIKRLPGRTRCRFAVAPDVVCDAPGTLARSLPMLDPIRALVPVAYVAQNGATDGNLPWNRFDALFLGGDTAWKLGAEARGLAAAARDRGKWLHMGRVNSHRRMRYAEFIGCDSVDGTYLAFGPDINLPRLLGWVATGDVQPSLQVTEWEAACTPRFRPSPVTS